MTDTGWLLDPDVTYLNHGGFGALPVPVAAAADAIRRTVEANPTDLFVRRWQGLIDGVRADVAAFLRAEPDDVVFVPNATTGTATVLTRLELGPGDEVVTTDHRYPSLAEQVAVLAARGVRTVEVPVPLDIATPADVVARITAAITPATRVVVVDQVASATGFVFPVREIVVAAHERGVPVLVDAAHAPGQLDVDLGALEADFWVGNLHKWVCSPRSCSVLVVAPRWQDQIRPLVPSHDFRDGYRPAFDWTGSADPIPLLAVPAALEFWAGLGWPEVRRRQRALVDAGAAVVAERLRTRVPVADQFSAAIRVVTLPRPLSVDERRETAARLTVEHRVTANVTQHAGSSYIRMCGQVYNRPEDYERLATALVDVLG